jgi:hypothetical protein
MVLEDADKEEVVGRKAAERVLPRLTFERVKVEVIRRKVVVGAARR